MVLLEHHVFVGNVIQRPLVEGNLDLLELASPQQGELPGAVLLYVGLEDANLLQAALDFLVLLLQVLFRLTYLLRLGRVRGLDLLECFLQRLELVLVLDHGLLNVGLFLLVGLDVLGVADKTPFQVAYPVVGGVLLRRLPRQVALDALLLEVEVLPFLRRLLFQAALLSFVGANVLVAQPLAEPGKDLILDVGNRLFELGDGGPRAVQLVGLFVVFWFVLAQLPPLVLELLLLALEVLLKSEQLALLRLQTSFEDLNLVLQSLLSRPLSPGLRELFHLVTQLFRHTFKILDIVFLEAATFATLLLWEPAASYVTAFVDDAAI